MITEKVKGFIGGLLVATGTWFLIVNLRDYLLRVSPITNQYVIGTLLIIIGGYISSKKLFGFLK